jgi:hypothetical protein
MMDLFEREKALFRNDNLRTNGREIDPKRARRFLTTVMEDSWGSILGV